MTQLDKPQTIRLDEESTLPEVNPLSSSVSDRVQSLAVVGKPQEESRAEAELGDATVVYEAKGTTQKDPYTLVTRTLETQSLTADELQTSFVQLREKSEVEQELEDFYVEQGILVEGVEYTPTDIRYTTNILQAEQMFRDAISEVEDDTSLVGKVGDFVDRYFLRQIPIGMVEDLTRRSERKGSELLQAAVTMNPREYKEFISGYIEELRAEGFFMSDNLFALQDGFEEATNAGYDPWATFNQILAGGEAFSLAKGTFKVGKALATQRGSIEHADSILGRVGSLSGTEAATETGEKIIRASDEVDGALLTKMGPSAFDDGQGSVRPHGSKVAEIMENNQIVRDVVELDKKGAFGRTSTPELVQGRAKEISLEYGKRVANPVYTYRVMSDILNNPITEVDFGKIKDGTPYKREADAKKVLSNANLPEGEVVPVDQFDKSKGYVIRVQQRMDLTKLVDELNPNQTEYGFIRDTIAKFFGSNAALDDEHLTALANMAEAGASSVKESSRTFEKALAKVPRDSKKTIVRIFKELRDGKDADLKEGYTRGEWVDKFKTLHPNGLAPTQRDLEAYDALVQFEDAGWLFSANESLLRYVRKGYHALDLGDAGRTIGKKVDNLDEEVVVLNTVTNAKEKALNLTEGHQVWRLDRPLDDGTEYISNPQNVSILDHSDVMGFNSGGRRINPKTNYFVNFMGDNPRAFLSAFSEKQARKAVDELNTIQKALKAIDESLENITATDELDEIIRNNNDWNPSITGWDDLKSLINEKKWDFTKEISYKERDGEVLDLSKDSPHGGSRWDGYVKTQLNRYNDVLLEYGGGEAFNVDPVNAILDEFARASTHYTHKAYTQVAAAAWTKRAARQGSGVKLSENYAKDDYLNQVQHAEITGNSESARNMRHLRSIIRRRLNMKGPVAQRFEALGQEMAEAVFDKTGLKMNVSDPSNALLHVGFQSAFGFFNVSQFFMQGMHAVTVAAISPVHGTKAASITLPLRAAIHAPTPEASRLAIQRLAKSAGESEEVMQELVEYMRTSGRLIVEGDAIELGTGPSYGVSGWGSESYLPDALSNSMQKASLGGSRLLHAGLMPFRSGERLGRMTAISTAFLEFKKKNPNVSALSDVGRRWITTREQNLTFNMTAAGRALFQSGMMKVPTQWLSYSFRSMEAIVLGRGFTAAERARLATVLMPFYGLTGMGLGTAADWATEAFGVEDPEMFIAMKYGVIDYLIAELTPVETSLSTRLAPITAFTDLYSKIVGGESTVLETALGPSGDIAGGISRSIINTVGELTQGNTVSLTQDALQILRQPSGLDNVAKGIGILNNGVYRSKTGATLPTELKPADALISFLGFSPLEVAEFYSRNGGRYVAGKKYRKFAREMDKDMATAISLLETDADSGLQMIKEIDTKIALSGFAPPLQMRLRQNLIQTRQDDIYKMYKDYIQRDMQLSARMLEELLGGEN